jgi:GTP pyrophosphokinase
LRPRLSKKQQAAAKTGFRIRGVGNLLTSLARCCNPVPNDPIIGYITRGRGVTIHRQDCGNILRLQGEERARLIEVDWGAPSSENYPVDISIEAYDRGGLLRDIAALLANEKINVTGVNTTTDPLDGIARMNLSLEISDISQLSRVLSQIGQLQNVVEARRRN